MRIKKDSPDFASQCPDLARDLNDHKASAIVISSQVVLPMRHAGLWQTKTKKPRRFIMSAHTKKRLIEKISVVIHGREDKEFELPVEKAKA